MSSPLESIEFLVNSPTRVRILDELRREGRVSRDDLKTRLDASRSTLQRNLGQLEQRNWIARFRSEYRITPLGRMVGESLSTLIDTMELNDKLAPFLEWIPPEQFDIDLGYLRDATVTVSHPTDPYAPVNRHMQALQNAGRYTALLPSVSQQGISLGRQRMVEGAASKSELVIEREVAETLQATPQYRQMFEEMVETGLIDVYVYDGQLPFYLGIVDDLVQVGAEDDNGLQRALLESTDPNVLRWARQKYLAVKGQATRVSRDQEIDLDAFVPRHAEFAWITPTGVEASLNSLVELFGDRIDRGGPGVRVADVGCGTGRLTAALADAYPAATVVGVDPAEPATVVSRERTRRFDNVEVVRGTVDALSPGGADYLYAINMVNDTPDPRQTVERLYDSLAAGGAAVVTVPHGGAEELFVAPARVAEGVDVVERDGMTVIASERFTAEVTQLGGMTHLRVTATIDDTPDGPRRLETEQLTVAPETFVRFARETGFDVHPEGTLACDPSGLPKLLGLLGYDEEANRWAQFVEAYRENPSSVADMLPTVSLYLLEKP